MAAAEAAASKRDCFVEGVKNGGAVFLSAQASARRRLLQIKILLPQVKRLQEKPRRVKKLIKASARRRLLQIKQLI